jgi:hypothetical protein
MSQAEVATVTKHDQFMAFLTEFCEATAKVAAEDGLGILTFAPKQIQENLFCMELVFTDQDETPDTEPREFRLFAAGRYRTRSMIRIEWDDAETESGIDFHLMNTDPELLVAFLSF